MFARIAERHPTTLIIDHMGLKFRAVPTESPTSRRRSITVALAKYPNVSVKLSGALGKRLELILSAT
jgi:predicted TIM-barrel fold metal-dependent hydrolase